MNGTTRNRRVWAGFKGITERGLAPGTGARLLTARGFFLNRLPPMSLARLAAGATRRGDRNHAPVTFAARTAESARSGRWPRNLACATYPTENPSFLNGDLPVYLPVDPALSSRPGGCDSVPPYPSGAHVTSLVVKVQSSPKAKATCSNRVGRAICVQNHEHFRSQPHTRFRFHGRRGRSCRKPAS
jgi:hypothetical protein